jgi:Periplasmic binding protein
MSPSSIGRTWRGFVRRMGTTRTTLVVLGVVAVIAVIVALVVSGGTSSSGSKTTTAAHASAATPVGQASTAAPGVTPTSIRVVFPVVSLNSLAGREGFATDTEYGWQEKAIHTFVDDINDKGGIHGRKIAPDIVSYDPTDEAGMRALCKDWTEGSDPAFAVLDGIGAWEGDNQLCVTQEGHTPFIGQWTTVTDWTTKGSPYLWWTGTDQSVLLDTLVSWAHRAGLLTTAHRVGIVVGDRASDKLVLDQTVLPALAKLGIRDPLVQTIVASPDAQTATLQAQAPLIVQRFEQARVTSVIPLIPFNSFFPYLQAETSQEYYPHLLLSDYESSIQVALGLIPAPYEKALDGQEGVTTLTLGGIDDTRSESQGGYDPGLRSCYQAWTAKNAPPPAPDSPYLEEQGPVAAWCQVIRLFAKAATDAGATLNRRTFVEAMAKVEDFPGTYSPILTYGPDKFYGPTQYQVVRLHNNVPPSSQCQLTYQHKAQGTCWVTVQSWRPLVTSR